VCAEEIDLVGLDGSGWLLGGVFDAFASRTGLTVMAP
jgi:hypothetical protein